MLTVACVRVGNKYPFSDVIKLKNMVARYLPMDHQFVCITDDPQFCAGVEYIHTGETGLRGWWAKMILFHRMVMPEGRLIYFDLDTVIVGDLTPLAQWDGTFGVCGNFTRAAGHDKYPCRYGSCVMSLAPEFGQAVWDAFVERKEYFFKECVYGDQQAIEALYPSAILLQDVLPERYFIGYRQLGLVRCLDSHIVVFGGSHKPHNCTIPWVREAWR